LRPHPEGGHYRESYRSRKSMRVDHLAGDWQGERNLCTVIFYLLGYSRTYAPDWAAHPWAARML